MRNVGKKVTGKKSQERIKKHFLSRIQSVHWTVFSDDPQDQPMHAMSFLFFDRISHV